MNYGYNLSNISLNQFKEIIEVSYLIPSMRPLLEDIDRWFALLDAHGISSVEALYKLTKTKKKAEVLAEQTGVDQMYMVLLRRMVSSYIAKPRKLVDYPDMSDHVLMNLSRMNIKNSAQLFEYLDLTEPEEIMETLQINHETFLLFQKLISVSMLRYVSPLFAMMLVRSGYDSIEKIAAGEKAAMLKAIVQTNVVEHIYKGNVGDSDSQFLIDDAKVFLRFRNSN